jgi:hypothetical protein
VILIIFIFNQDKNLMKKIKLLVLLIFANTHLCEAQVNAAYCNNYSNWKELGPFKKPNAGIKSIGSGSGQLGVGIINNIAVSRVNPNHLLSNSLAGGLFFSDDKGKNWSNAGSDSWYKSGCSFATFDPKDEPTWYATSTVGGSYKMRKNTQNPIGLVGGVYRTLNGGKTWEIIGDKSSFQESENTSIFKIIIDPNKTSTAYLSTFSGIYKSTNLKDSASNIQWSKVLQGYIEDIEFIANGGSMLIASNEMDGKWNISITNKKGTKWKKLQTPDGFFDTTQKIVIEVSEADPHKIFFLNQKAKTELWMYHLQTKKWIKKASNITNHCSNAHAFCISNFDTKTIYLGYANGSGKAIFFAKSDDEGETFKIVKTSLYHNDVEDIITPYNTFKNCSAEVYVSTHGGINYSADKNSINENLEDRSNGLGIAKSQGGSTASLTNPERMTMGVDHDGTVISTGEYSENWIPEWTTVSGGDGGQALIDYADANNVWIASNDSPHKLSQSGGLNGYKSTSFKPVEKNAYNSIVQNKALPEIVYSRSKTNIENGKYEDIFRSNSRGLGNVERITDFYKYNNLDSNYYCFGNIFTSPNNKDYLYVGMTNTRNWDIKFFRNKIATDSAEKVMQNWEELKLPQAGFNGAIADLNNPEIVYFSYSGNEYGTAKFYVADYSKPTTTFINIAGKLGVDGLPNTKMCDIVLAKDNLGGIYIATDLGVYYTNKNFIDMNNDSENNATKWYLLGAALPHIPVNGMDINYQVKKIRVFTAGRGVWEHDLFCE